MGVTEDEEPDLRVDGESGFGPFPLQVGCRILARGVTVIVIEVMAEPIDQPEAEVGRHGTEDGAGQRVTGQVVEATDAPPFRHQPVAMVGLHDPGPDGEPNPVAGKPDATFGLPEGVSPPVVVATGHDNRELPGQDPQLAGDPEPSSGDRPAIRKPEVEEVTVDEQAVPEGRHSIEERQHRLLGGLGNGPKVGVAEDDELLAKHGSKYRNPAQGIASRVRDAEGRTTVSAAQPISEIIVRVNYSETDRMGVAYHGRYPAWLDMARTEHLRSTGISYRELEDGGLLLTVSSLQVRYRRAAQYDDLVRIRCWVREIASRKVTFGYLLEHQGRGEVLATATTSLIGVDRTFAVVRLPDHLIGRLKVSPDLVRL